MVNAQKRKVTRPCRHSQTNAFLVPVGTVQGRGQADGGWSAKRSTDVVRQLWTHDCQGAYGFVVLRMWRRQTTIVDGDRQRQRVDSRPSSTVGLAHAALWALARPAWTELVGGLETSAAAGEQAIFGRAIERRWSDMRRRSGPLEAVASVHQQYHTWDCCSSNQIVSLHMLAGAVQCILVVTLLVSFWLFSCEADRSRQRCSGQNDA